MTIIVLDYCRYQRWGCDRDRSQCPMDCWTRLSCRTWTRTRSHHRTRILALDDCRYRRRAGDLDDGRTPSLEARWTGHQHGLVAWCQSRAWFEHHDQEHRLPSLPLQSLSLSTTKRCSKLRTAQTKEMKIWSSQTHETRDTRRERHQASKQATSNKKQQEAIDEGTKNSTSLPHQPLPPSHEPLLDHHHSWIFFSWYWYWYWYWYLVLVLEREVDWDWHNDWWERTRLMLSNACDTMFDERARLVLVQAWQNIHTTVAEAKYDTVCPHKTMAGPAGRTVEGACHGFEGVWGVMGGRGHAVCAISTGMPRQKHRAPRAPGRIWAGVHIEARERTTCLGERGCLGAPGPEAGERAVASVARARRLRRHSLARLPSLTRSDDTRIHLHSWVRARKTSGYVG